MKNSEIINQPNYYQLPTGKYLEDFIAYKGLDFATGSAVKYGYRAGKKDGESAEKDLNKKMHYVRFISTQTNQSVEDVLATVDHLLEEAQTWTGVVQKVQHLPLRELAQTARFFSYKSGMTEQERDDSSRIARILDRLFCFGFDRNICRKIDSKERPNEHWWGAGLSIEDESANPHLWCHYKDAERDFKAIQFCAQRRHEEDVKVRKEFVRGLVNAYNALSEIYTY